MIVTMNLNTARQFFFDRKAVMDAMSKAQRQVFSAAGANVRKHAQRSIKIRPRPSLPGTPPHGHKTGSRTRVSKSTGKVRVQKLSPLREYIWFLYDPNSKTAVIGPIPLPGKGGRSVLQPLEYGGTATIQRRPRRGGRPRGVARVNVRARPFMRPALRKELPNIPRLWASKVK